MLGKVFFVVLSCSLLLNPLATYARNYPCSGKKGGVSHVPLMANSFAMMELLVNPKKSVLKTHDNFCFYICA